MARAPRSAEYQRLSTRESVLLEEVLRIESQLQEHRSLSTDYEREAYELLLDQLQMVMDRFSPEDDFLWNQVLRVALWLREDTLARTRSGKFSFQSLIRDAEEAKGGPLSEEEMARFYELAVEMAEVNRLLTNG